ncbi:NUDT9P1 protein [Salpingoeca rosetta]|uniref:NUDT9P1 protein n=1 Tax=Salpingoeca rosetta (strain ATCC 50818 / BSB-021) TaxID=946362 RepID=F2U684_SALR5|nr:NUDT9P1 protein [Salpingoeca rosetta]EGD83025.1 NUDT9P1 protein [Salpingoeca rosetta]|eukprot:XP_004995389.1 NUDT9P1 protein [Salpingoeca rosetta]
MSPRSPLPLRVQNSRWRRDAAGKVVKDENGTPILEMVCIKRKDNGEWAIPGGMVDPKEHVSATLAREFSEEALNTLDMPEAKRAKTLDAVSSAFHKGEVIYRGYVDDPRNTDNAWMETTVMNFHDDKGDVFGAFELTAGDDAGAVTWVPITPGMPLYASHYDFVKETYKRRTGKNL